MTHVPEHLAQAGEGRERGEFRAPPPPPDGPEPKAKGKDKAKGKRPEPIGKEFEPLDRPGSGLPPALPPG